MAPDAFPGPRAFARHMLQGDRLSLRPLYESIMTFRGAIIESILFRESCWQVELIASLPNAGTEVHRHMRCASADLLLNGGGIDAHGGVEIKGPRGPLAAQLKSIAVGKWHGGFSGPAGFVYLSFQQWQGEPTFISQDWDVPRP